MNDYKLRWGLTKYFASSAISQPRSQGLFPEKREDGCFSGHGITKIYVVYYGGVEKQRRETLFNWFHTKNVATR